MNDNLENEEPFNIFQYVKENYLGLGLFIFAFFIIYFVDYINVLNGLLYSNLNPAPSITFTNNPSKKKIKKR